MLKELQDIDTKDVEALAGIKSENDVVQKLIEKANSSKDKVATLIYERVMADYDARLKALDAQARPLRQKARAELAKLQALHNKLAQGLEAAKLDLSELEFRHEIGELADDVFETKREAAQEALTTSQANFDEAEKIRQRFLEVLPAEPDPPAPPPPPPAPAPPPAAPAPLPDSSTQVIDAAEVTGQIERPPSTLVGVSAPAPDMGTIAVSREEAMALSAGAPAPGFGTMVMPRAKLVKDDDDGKGTEFMLGAVTSLGRTPDNSIPLDKPEVSRRHARIIMGEDRAFTIIDNNSNNGTFVNGDRTKECRLRDGDRIQIGTNQFIFREG
jgi:hypothetical protein